MLAQTQSPAQTYTDLNGLQGIRALGKQDPSAALQQVAKQFESMFVQMMMRSMRDASAVFQEDSLLSSPEGDFYQQMYDDQLSLSLTGGAGMGLAQVLYRQLEKNYGKQNTTPEIDQSQFSSQPSQTIKPFAERLERTIKEVEHERQIQPLRTQPPVNANLKRAEPVASAAQGAGDKGQQFASAADFVAALYPHAEKIGAELGVDPKAIVAQAALETGWGRYMISDATGKNSFNFFGIKADSRWSGAKVAVQTHEFRQGRRMTETADFRSYDSLEAGLRDYANFLQHSERYQSVLGQGLSGEHYGHALQQAGYATDPEYGNKIQRISRSETLNQALSEPVLPL